MRRALLTLRLHITGGGTIEVRHHLSLSLSRSRYPSPSRYLSPSLSLSLYIYILARHHLDLAYLTIARPPFISTKRMFQDVSWSLQQQRAKTPQIVTEIGSFSSGCPDKWSRYPGYPGLDVPRTLSSGCDGWVHTLSKISGLGQ